MSLTLHHLDDSRSIRILWLLEEAGLPYRLVRYQRDAQTRLAPPSLKAIHPLGKSPVIEDDGRVITESGAIVQYLIARHARYLAPAEDTAEYLDYLQWIHFAESSAMLPVLLKIFEAFECKTGTRLNFLPGYTEDEFTKVFAFLDQALASREFIVGDHLSGADIMLGFVVGIVTERFGLGATHPHLQRYAQRLQQLPGWQRAQAIEAEWAGQDRIERSEE
ncbi:glutathione S-transferase family protein [Enterobacter asburiae]